jgi:hypothetical protein
MTLDWQKPYWLKVIPEERIARKCSQRTLIIQSNPRNVAMSSAYATLTAGDGRIRKLSSRLIKFHYEKKLRSWCDYILHSYVKGFTTFF